MIDEEPTPVGAESVDGREAAAGGGTSVEAEDVRASTNENEETPVIDVHVPHGGMHTWKDFWIHLGTITLGLLIAISLEQSVEWMHRLHERSQLEEDLHVEGEHNHRHAEIDIAICDKVIAWLIELQHGAEQARVMGGKAEFVYPPRPDGIPDSPRFVAYHVLETEAWTTAKESSLLVLLPRSEAEIYARGYIQVDQVQTTRERARDAGIQQGAFETRFSHGMYPPTIDLTKLTSQQLDEYDTLLSEQLEAVRVSRVRLKIFAAANDYILAGGRSDDDLRKAILKANMPQ